MDWNFAPDLILSRIPDFGQFRHSSWPHNGTCEENHGQSSAHRYQFTSAKRAYRHAQEHTRAYKWLVHIFLCRCRPPVLRVQDVSKLVCTRRCIPVAKGATRHEKHEEKQIASALSRIFLNWGHTLTILNFVSSDKILFFTHLKNFII